MDVREKLVELLTDNLPRCGNLPRWDNPLQFSCDEQVQRIADHLIANEVTVQENTAADVTPVRHGRWVDKPLIKSFKHTNIPVVECSACGIDFCDIINNHYFMYKYCLNCGAKMDGGAD